MKKSKKLSYFKLLILSILIGHCIGLGAQETNPYKTTLELDIPLISLGTTSMVLSHLWTQKIPGLTEEQLMNVNRDEVFKFESGIINNWSPKTAKVSDVPYCPLFC